MNELLDLLGVLYRTCRYANLEIITAWPIYLPFTFPCSVQNLRQFDFFAGELGWLSWLSWLG